MTTGGVDALFLDANVLVFRRKEFSQRRFTTKTQRPQRKTTNCLCPFVFVLCVFVVNLLWFYFSSRHNQRSDSGKMAPPCLPLWWPVPNSNL